MGVNISAYPKLLYSTPQDYTIIADANEEEAARKAGFKDYADVLESEDKPKRGRPAKVAESEE